VFSHCSGKVDTDLKIFREVTAFAERANNAAEAADIIDRALTTAVRKKRPVYIEIPRNLWHANIMAPVRPPTITLPPSDAEEEIAKKILAFMRGAQRPAILLGVEVQRYGAIEQVTALVKKLGIPYSTTMLAKSVIAENTPNFVGVYDSRYAPPNVINVIEKSDRLLALGCVFGVQHLNLLPSLGNKIVRVFDGEVRVGGEQYKNISLKALTEQLNRAEWQANPAWSSWIAQNRLEGLSYDQRRASMKNPVPPSSNEAAMTYDEVMRGVSDFLDESFVTITDTSLSMYPAADMDIKGAGGMFCNAVWQSIGYSVAAAVGAGVAQQKRRPLVICGDGGFQMTAQSLSTMALRNIRSIVIVLDNGFYGIEQFLIDRSYFNNPSSRPPSYLSLHPWKYADLARSFGINAVWEAADTASFQQALHGAKDATGPAFIAVKLKRKDLPPELRA
jgi:indolepyruvate decarboxylase